MECKNQLYVRRSKQGCVQAIQSKNNTISMQILVLSHVYNDVKTYYLQMSTIYKFLKVKKKITMILLNSTI